MSKNKRNKHYYFQAQNDSLGIGKQTNKACENVENTKIDEE